MGAILVMGGWFWNPFTDYGSKSKDYRGYKRR